MARDYRPALRKLTVLLPKLVQASHIKKAYDLEKVIKASFDFPSDLNALMGGMPPNHREEFIRQYKNYCFAAYEAGIKHAGTDAEMPFGLYQEVFNGFLEKVKDLISSMKTQGEILSSVEKNIKEAYKQGASEAIELTVQTPQIPKVDEVQVQASLDVVAVGNKQINDLVKALLAKYESMRSEPKLLACLVHYKTGQPLEIIVPEVKQVYASVSPVTAEEITICSSEEVNEALARHGLNFESIIISEVDSNYVLAAMEPTSQYPKALEDYVKLLGPGKAEEVLRAFMGMKSSSAPAPVVEAALEEVTAETLLCGPFNVPALKDRLLQAIGSHSVAEADTEQVVTLDCLVSNLSEKSDDEKAQKICEALNLPPLSEEMGHYTLVDAMHGADMIALELTHEMGLPGNFVFVDAGDDYCLAYIYPTDTALQHSKLSQKIATAARKSLGTELPPGPQGALDLRAQKEIEAVCKYQSLRQLAMKDIKERAPTVAKHIKECLSEFQANMMNLGEACDCLSMSIPNLVKAIYGMDGLAYLNHCQTEAKAAKARKKR